MCRKNWLWVEDKDTRREEQWKGNKVVDRGLRKKIRFAAQWVALVPLLQSTIWSQIFTNNFQRPLPTKEKLHSRDFLFPFPLSPARIPPDVSSHTLQVRWMGKGIVMHQVIPSHPNLPCDSHK